MNFALTSDQQAVFDLAREFAKDQLEPNAIAWDQAEYFPLDLIRSTAELGFGGIDRDCRAR